MTFMSLILKYLQTTLMAYDNVIFLQFMNNYCLVPTLFFSKVVKNEI